MSGLQAGALPDLVVVPEGTERGVVVVLGGIRERSADYVFLLDILRSAGYRTVVFDDVSFDAEAARVGAEQVLREYGGSGLLAVIGSDVGAVVAAELAIDRPGEVGALILANIATSDTRLPPGLFLPAARRVPLPTLVFHGDSDEVTDVADIAAWATELPFGALRIVRNGDHTLLSNASRRTVAASILLFVERHEHGEAILADTFGR
ncbi:hypothetical protein GCM10025867_35490 [Frondihabitans sucicola]|uniref:Alpha/beta hydrolase n=1 Tax=Frondihabitans sucicola TaxID=1268041 RepID=A0ABM8GSL6_9MICO|nr:hypothetical protein [Frondihabitans sucicola]BDZ51308.1 hypothetical protein GCM10025867_35490 [Frondihabitans sucicola]